MGSGSFSIPVVAISNRLCSPGAWYKYQVFGAVYTSTDADIIASIRANDPSTSDVRLSEEAPPPNPLHSSTGGTGTLLFDMDTAHITLTGSVSGVFDISGLPAGFTIATAVIHFRCQNSLGSTAITKDGFTETSGAYSGSQQTFSLTGPFPTAASVFEAVYGFVFSTVAGWMPPLTAFAYGFSVTGTYTIVDYTFTLDPSANPIHEGSIVKVTADGATPIDPTLITTVTLVFSGGTIDVPPANWIQVSPTVFWFVIPPFGIYTPPTVEIVVNTPQPGSPTDVVLGFLPTIYLTSAPGAYVLTPGQNYDVLYDIVDGGTVNVKIPNPYARTAFVP